MRLIAVLLGLLTFMQIAAAAAAAPGEYPELIVDLRVNGQQADSALIVRRDSAGTLLVRGDDLARLRLRLPDSARVDIDGVKYLRLGPGQGAAVNFDPATLVVEVTLPPQAFEATHASYQADAVLPVAPTRPGGFLNYDASVEQTGSSRYSGAFVELGLYGARGVVTNTLVGQAGDDGTGLTRLETAWTLDLPERLATLRLGDAISVPTGWSRSLRFAGIQFGTNFSTRPDLITTPMLAASGEAVLPSTVDVFINGRQVANQAVLPGPFTVDNLPAISGAGEMQVVVTDALGRQQVVSQPYYSGVNLLRAGLDQYSLELGSVRLDYGQRSGAYGDMLLAGTFRRGLTNSLTLGAHAEAESSGVGAAGLDAALQVGTLGVLGSTVAIGGNGAGAGWLSGFGFEHRGRWLGFSAGSQFSSNDFAQVGDLALANKPKLRSFVGASVNLQRGGSVQLAYGRQSFWDAPEAQTIGLSYTLSLGRAGFLGLYASHSLASDDRSDVMLSWTVSFGDRRSASASGGFTRDREASSRSNATVAMQQSLPAGSGSSWFLSASTDELQRAGYAYQGSAGLVGVEYARTGQVAGLRASATGGVALTEAGIMPARRLDGSFAVVQVADYEGLTVYVDNQPVGKTDSKGRVLIDGLRAYESNMVSLDPTEVPMDASLSVARMDLTPAYRSGPLVSFPVERSHAAILRLVRDDGSFVPAGSAVMLGQRSYPVGLDGLAYLEEIGSASEAMARWSGGQCRFELQRPVSDEPIPDLGRVSCRPTVSVAPQE
jgi:outer membrane usher protein